jgi:hypothetical protein
MVAPFDELSIERAFNRCLDDVKNRWATVHADVWRHGNPGEIADALKQLAEGIDERCERVPFEANEDDPGGARVRLRLATERLLEHAEAMKALKKSEGFDYHWAIVGDLVGMIGALLDHIEDKGAGG